MYNNTKRNFYNLSTKNKKTINKQKIKGGGNTQVIYRKINVKIFARLVIQVNMVYLIKRIIL